VVAIDETKATEANLWKDLATARESLADTAGTRPRATSMFTTTDLYGFVTRQVDKTDAIPNYGTTSNTQIIVSHPRPR
jgi:hypothetical protein